MLLARRLVNGRECGCLQVVSCSVLRLVNMSTRAMRLKTQARALACLQVVYLTLSVVKEQSLSASLVRLEKELFPLYLATASRRSATGGYDLRKEDRQFALQSSRREKCDSFKLDDTLQRKAHTRLPLFVFPTRSLSQPLTEHGERFSYAFKS